MYQPLIPCHGCARHVLSGECECPFCGAALPSDFARAARPDVTRRMSRAAAAALGATLALASCSSTVGGGDAGATGDTPAADAPADQGSVTETGIAPAYGKPPPPVDAGPPDDNGGPMAEYGSPPPPMDAGGNVNLYGAPPPPQDAAVRDAPDVLIAPLYGAPPDFCEMV